MAAEELLDLLRARAGLVCAIGAGGKKTTLYRLATLHPGRVALTSTVMIPPFPRDLAAHIVREPADSLLAAVRRVANSQCVAYTQLSSKRGRFEGVAPTQVQDIHQQLGFDATFIKADGARNRLVKAPANDEPQLPKDPTTVIPVVSARAINQALTDRIAHRVEKIEQVTGVHRGEPLTPLHIARLLASEQGLLKDVAGAQVVPLINMVDGDELRALARQTAEAALKLTTRFDHVVLASMPQVDPVVQVIHR